MTKTLVVIPEKEGETKTLKQTNEQFISILQFEEVQTATWWYLAERQRERKKKSPLNYGRVFTFACKLLVFDSHKKTSLICNVLKAQATDSYCKHLSGEMPHNNHQNNFCI